jgi:hypothetical protein
MHFKDIFCLTIFSLLSTSFSVCVFAENDKIQEQLNPRGKVHIPIGIANTLDTLKTFVEAEGIFSPGVGSYGIYFWLFDRNTGRLIAPTMDGVKCEHGLADGKYLIPWSKWSAGDITVKTEVCEVKRPSPKGEVFIVGSRVTLENTGKETKKIALYVALRALGPAGFDIKKLTVSKEGDALLVDDHPAIVATTKPAKAGVLANDTIGEFALQGRMPKDKSAISKDGNCSGALQLEITLGTGGSKTFSFICPVLPGRRAVGHQWDGVSEWVQFDLAKLNPPIGGVLQPDAGLNFYRKLNVAELFDEAKNYCKQLVERVQLNLPDKRWEGAFTAIIGHAAMEMNEGAPDVAVVNYNVFNRDGVYVANIFQKSGNMDLAAAAIDYFTKHPFNGRSYPEADNPGQILWAMDQQWRFTHDRIWLKRIYPAARKIAEMIKYYRTESGPHWVQMDSLDFGSKLPEEKRRELKPGWCDGHHPEYTEAFDIAGLQSAAVLAEALGLSSEATQWKKLAIRLLETYDNKFGKNLGKGYGSFSVLWPCSLYPIDSGKAYEQFKGYGKQNPSGWRYFPLAKAHQGLLAGNREAGYGTLQLHLDHEQMRGWYAFDEGGRSGSGGWGHVRTTWNSSVAMPHGWAIAEVWLLMRDCLVFEANQRLVLFAGVPPAWFTHKDGMTIRNLPTCFGKLNMHWKPTQIGATLRLDGEARPPKGFDLRLPESLKSTIRVGGQTISTMSMDGFTLPPETQEVHINFAR